MVIFFIYLVAVDSKGKEQWLNLVLIHLYSSIGNLSFLEVECPYWIGKGESK